jgi:hypothetical protein
MTEDNCWDLLYLSAELLEEELGDVCANFIKSIPNILTNPKFLSLNLSTTAFLFKRKTIPLELASKLKIAW